MKQKFPRGSFVHVTKNLPGNMSHFEKDFDAVVEYTYAQRYGGKGQNQKEYSVIVLSKGKPVNSIAWYKEEHLTLLKGSIEEGKKLIEEFHYGSH